MSFKYGCKLPETENSMSIQLFDTKLGLIIYIKTITYKKKKKKKKDTIMGCIQKSISPTYDPFHSFGSHFNNISVHYMKIVQLPVHHCDVVSYVQFTV